jgi:membrane-bound serine protease (ClpP class)
LVIGSMILIDAPDPAIQIRASIALAVAIPLAVVMYVILYLALRSRHQKVVTGDQGIVGEVGVARTEINPEGRVFVHGEWWSAVSQARIPSGERVRIVGMDGLRLRVEAVSPTAPRQASVVEADSNGKEQKHGTGS